MKVLAKLLTELLEGCGVVVNIISLSFTPLSIFQNERLFYKPKKENLKRTE